MIKKLITIFLMVMLTFSFYLTKINALSVDNTELPEIPSLSKDKYIIVKQNCSYISESFCDNSQPDSYQLVVSPKNLSYYTDSNGVYLWPGDNIITRDIDVYKISNNEWSKIMSDNAFFVASYFNKIVYSNYDVKYKDSDEIYFSSTPAKIDYILLGNKQIIDNDSYILEYEIKNTNIENKNTYNFKIEIEKDSIMTPNIVLYKVVNNEYLLIEDETYINYTYSESLDENNIYVLTGSITFSKDVSYVNDYILRFKYENISDTNIYFYADYALNNIYIKNSFLEDYRLYYFPKNHNYAFISSDTAVNGTIYAENRFVLNNKTNDNKRFNSYYFEYERRDYLSRIMPFSANNKDYQKFDFKLDYDKNKIVVLKQFNANEIDNIGALFYVHKDFRVSFADASLEFTPDIIIESPNGNINYNNYAWALEGDLANIKDEEITSPIPDNNYENTDDLYTEASSFLEKIKFVVVPIFSLFDFLFNSLNPYIKSAIISLFIILILCVILRKLFNS